MQVLDLRNSMFETLLNWSIAKLEYLCGSLFTQWMHGLDIETLPKWLGKLISLWELCITTKQSVMSLNKFTNFKHLRKLGFHDCDNLNLFLSGKQQLPSLETLNVKSCGSLESFLFIFSLNYVL